MENTQDEITGRWFKITIVIFVNTSDVPYSVRFKLAPEIMEQLELAMRNRYDFSQKVLDLESLLYDPGFAHLDIDIILNRRNCMAATLQIIEKDFPELLSLNLRNNKLYQLDGLSDIVQMAPTVKILNLSRNELKSVWELGKIKGLKLEELWLEGNPFCDNFQSQFTYISAVRKYFPELLYLDGQDLPPTITTDIDRPYLVKPLIKESCKGLDDLKTQVLQFLQQSSLFEYFKVNRNMKNLQDPNLRFQLLKHTKRDIVSSLCVFPKTQHDFNSFLVDVWLQSVSTLFLPGAGPEICSWELSVCGD
uniref:Nuclear RNA export factor 5 n=1 Tax=Pipistrellus kuhlii TaxID=59472 RepID=A0A7J7V6B7_PIPKU|nr:nuclear RNA export factor 5 [Pipistrellus kuhlii]